MTINSKILQDSTVRIPDEIIKATGLKPGTNIIWYYDEETKQIMISEKPENFAQELRGLGKDIWKGTDANSYIHEERKTWN